MWRHYLTVGIRSLVKNKAYAFINIFGLAIGLAACLMILIFVRYEFGYDRDLTDAARTYQLQDYHLANGSGSEPQFLQNTSYVAGKMLRKDFPQIERAVYVTSAATTVVKDGQPLAISNAFLTDGPLFDVLHIPFVHGDPAHALDDSNALTLSETTAEQIFGKIDPIGRTVTLTTGDQKRDYRVTGVFRDAPDNSNLAFNAVARFDPSVYFAKNPLALTSWGWHQGQYWVRLKQGADPEAIHAAMPAWKKRNIPDDFVGGERVNPGDNHEWRLVNIRDIHLGKAQNGAIRPGYDRSAIVTFAVIAVLILAMACVNFINLATARATQRAREVALRKVLGATRTQLIVQFIGEAVLLAGFATLVALALTEMTLPMLSAFLHADLAIQYFTADGLILPVLVLTFVVGLAGGLYPAVVLSRFEPARVLKANKSTEGGGSGRLRNILVIAQFAVSIGLIICTAVIYAQTVFARSVDPGFVQKGLVQIAGIDQPEVDAVARPMMDEIRRIPGVVGVTRSGIGVNTGRFSSTDVTLGNRSDRITLGYYDVDVGFFDAMGMRMIAGRDFSDARPSDDATLAGDADPAAIQAILQRGISVIVTEEAARRLGFANPANAINQRFKTGHLSRDGDETEATIIGVVTDARFRSVRDPVQPIFFQHRRSGMANMFVRFQGVEPGSLDARVGSIWKRLVPDYVYRSRFVADVLRDMYDNEERRAQLFATFSLLAVVIGCLGLFGLATFTAERRTKEIGIRKVLGARSRDIVRLLAWQFSKPVMAANIIAWPTAWWVMRDWLNSFDTRISLGIGPFLLAGFIALAIAIGTVAGHAIRLGRMNPIHALRYE